MINPVVALLIAVALLHPFPHGTAILTMAIRDGFIMGADGMTVFQGGIDAKPGVGIRAVVEPKIAICAKRLLCGMAGINPIHNRYPGGLVVEYDFQEWISRIPGNDQTSPRQFADAMQLQARSTFKDMDSIMKIDPFWKSKAAPQLFIGFQVDGYEGDAPQVCEVWIKANLQSYELEYPPPDCSAPEWKSPSPTSARPALLSGYGLNDMFTPGTARQLRLAEIKSRAIAAVIPQLPDSPPPIQETAGITVAVIKVMEEFNPDQFGGPITIGILEKGQLPRVVQYQGF